MNDTRHDTSAHQRVADPVTLTCPTRCMSLSQSTHLPLLQAAPTVSDVIALCRTGTLRDVPNIGPARAAEIENALARLRLWTADHRRPDGGPARRD